MEYVCLGEGYLEKNEVRSGDRWVRETLSRKKSLQKRIGFGWGFKEDILRAQLLDTESREPLSHINGLFECFALDDASDEAAGEGVTAQSSVRSTAVVHSEPMIGCITHPAPLVS